MRTFVTIILISLVTACATKDTYVAYQTGLLPKEENCEIAYYSQDPERFNNSEVIGVFSVQEAGLSINCDIATVRNKIILRACSEGADVVRLLEERLPSSSTGTCYQVRVQFLKLNNYEVDSEKIDEGNILYEQNKYSESFDVFLALSEESDNPQVQHYLAYAYENGEGVEQDVDKAISLYEQAANKGYTKSKLNLGFIYRAQQSNDEAYEWFSSAAEDGDAVAQFHTGGLLLFGSGIDEQDNEIALEWIRKSANNSYPIAIEFLDKYESSILEDIKETNRIEKIKEQERINLQKLERLSQEEEENEEVIRNEAAQQAAAEALGKATYQLVCALGGGRCPSQYFDSYLPINSPPAPNIYIPKQAPRVYTASPSSISCRTNSSGTTSCSDGTRYRTNSSGTTRDNKGNSWRTDSLGTVRGSDGTSYRTNSSGATRDNKGNSWRTDSSGTVRGSDGTVCHTNSSGTTRCQ